MDNSESIRSRIYEKLSTLPEPSGYKGKIPWIVQQQIAATNGMHFVNAIGTLNEYPIPEIPVKAGNPNDILLDIGNGWGRWLVAAANKDFIPVGIDIRLEFCETARAVLNANGKNGYTVVADLQNLPFLNDVFNVVWSFSVIQHTHFDRLTRCIADVSRVLKDEGYCFLEFPNKKGIRNRFGPAAGPNNMDFDSWDVRYYTPEEYKEVFNHYFDNLSYFNHSVLGIGILPGDSKHVKGIKNKAIIAASRTLSKLAEVIEPIKTIADSIYIQSVKHSSEMDTSAENRRHFLQSHKTDPTNNLNIVSILRCPVSGEKLFLSEDKQELICLKSGLAYPVKNETPVMIASEARTI